jgi:hypothetical protein
VKLRRCYLVEFTTRDGVRFEYGGEADGWKLLNPRNLGEKQRTQAEELIERAAGHATRAPLEELKDDELLGRAEYAARKLDLRITHRRMKAIKPPMR